jgi:hypothetical protein
MILILTEPADVHANRVVEKLQERGANFVRFNPAQLPTKAELSLLYPKTGRVQHTLRTDGKLIDLNTVRSVWYRRPRASIAHEYITDKPIRDCVEGECQNFVDDVWNSLDCLYVPAHHAVIQRAQLKASQLKVAGALGFELPPTLFTNSPKDFIEFYRQCNGNIVSKLAGISFYRAVGPGFTRYTEVVSKRDVGYANAVRHCPIIFQAYVPKRIELRITVVGEAVFAAEIHSQRSNHTRHDYRRYDENETLYLPHELPRDIEQRCRHLVGQLGLCYGAIDMVVTPDERYVFLEINSNGQYLWIELATGLPISDAICDLLLAAPSLKKPEARDLNHVLETNDE